MHSIIFDFAFAYLIAGFGAIYNERWRPFAKFVFVLLAPIFITLVIISVIVYNHCFSDSILDSFERWALSEK